MIKGAFGRHCSLMAICALVAACGGNKASTSDVTGNPPGGDDSGAGGDDAVAPPPPPDSDATTPVPPTKKDSGALKSIGSPCAADTECTSGTCDLTIPNGMCTKACTTDTDCSEKGNKTGAACVNSSCYEFCKDVDAGVVSDAGKPVAPCKNKALQCEDVSGETTPVCMYDSDAAVPMDDAGPVVDATTMDASMDATGE